MPAKSVSGERFLLTYPLDIKVIELAESPSLYIFSSQDHYQSRCDEELLISCFGLDSTTTSADHLLEQTHIPDRADNGVNCRASYGDGFLYVPIPCGFKGFTAVPFQGLTKRNTQCLQKFFFGCFLAVDAWNFLNPANPPITSFLGHGSINPLHLLSPLRPKHGQRLAYAGMYPSPRDLSTALFRGRTMLRRPKLRS